MQTTNQGRDFLSVEETAKILNLHRSTVYRQIATGNVPTVRFGKKGAIRVPRSALERTRSTR